MSTLDAETRRLASSGATQSDDPEVISQQIDHTRDAMADTLEEIQRRLEPEHVSSYVKDVAYYVALELKGVARDLAGEAMTNVRAGTARSAEALPGRESTVSTRLTEPTKAFFAKYSGRSTGKKAGQMSNQAQGIWQKLEANPIALGALGLAIGGLVGAVAPRLQQEDLIMGEAHDQVMENIQATASETVQSFRTAAKETGSEVLKEATSSHKSG